MAFSRPFCSLLRRQQQSLRSHGRSMKTSFSTSSWTESLKGAKNLIEREGSTGGSNENLSNSSMASSSSSSISDYSTLVQKDLDLIKKHLVQALVTTKHPVLKTMSSFYFTGAGAKGKSFRPLIVLLISKAMFPMRQVVVVTKGGRGLGEGTRGLGEESSELALVSETRTLLLSKLGFQPPCVGKPESEKDPFAAFSSIIDENDQSACRGGGGDKSLIMKGGNSPSPTSSSTIEILPKQKAIAEITEMIHTATLLHDDVIDGADTRRNMPSIPATFGNKLAILGGDYLLSRASVALARLQNTRVVDLLSQVIADLVEGEIMQLRSPDKIKQFSLEYYLDKCFSKTASLMAKSCQAAICVEPVWSNEESRICMETAAYEFGKNLGLAFQLMDDKLDFVQDSLIFGKPTGQDLKLGLATAPVLFASEIFPHLKDLFALNASDCDFTPEKMKSVFDCIRNSDALEKTQLLAEFYANEAKHYLYFFPQSEAREALLGLCDNVTTRSK